MEEQAIYQTSTSPVAIKDGWPAERDSYRWYHNGAAISALILLLNTIFLSWFAIFMEMLSPIIALIFSLLFAAMLAANAKGKSLT